VRRIVTHLIVSPVVGNGAVDDRTAVEASPDLEDPKEV